MSEHGTLYKIGKFLGFLGGQEEIYGRNLKPVANEMRMPMGELKAVPDDEVNPMASIAKNVKRAQNKQALLSIVCCVASIGFMILFYALFSGP